MLAQRLTSSAQRAHVDSPVFRLRIFQVPAGHAEQRFGSSRVAHRENVDRLRCEQVRASNARTRLKAAAFPVAKTLEEFTIAASSIPRATFDYLAGLEWIGAQENLCLVGPAGTGKSHMLIALEPPLSRLGTGSATSLPLIWSTPSAED